MAVDNSISDARLTDETLSELGLTEQPFVENKKLGRFSDSTSQKLRASLEQKLRFGQSVHLLTGDKGVGKSVFLSQLFKHCKNNLKPFVAKGDDNFSSLAFLAAVHHQLGEEEIEFESIHDYVDALIPLFDNLADDKMGVVLAIDDAHNAPVEEVGELINLMPAFYNDSEEPSARLLLVGEPVLAEELGALAEEFEDGAFDPTNSTLPTLDETRIQDYLSTRLKQAGFTDAFPFTDKVIAKIHRESDGLPSKINTSAADYLNKVYTAAPAKVGGKGFIEALGWPLVALGTAAVGLIAWGLSLFFVGNDPEPVVRINAEPTVMVESDDSTVVAEQTAGTDNPQLPSDSGQLVSEQLPAPAINSEPLVVGSNSSDDQTTDTLLKPEDQPLAQVTPSPTTEAGTDPLAESVATAQETVTEIVEAPVAQATELAGNATTEVQNAANTASSAGSDLLDTVNDTVAQRAEQISSDPTTVAGETGADQLAQSIVSGTAQALPESVEVAVPAAANTVVQIPDSATEDSDAASVDTQDDNGGIAVPLQPTLTDSNGVALDVDAPDAAPAVMRAVENERWVLFQDAGKFTVQLATSRERDYIIDLAQSLPATEPVAIYPFLTTNSKNPVFGLLSGLFDTRDEAQAAVDNMPGDAKQFGVWIRPIGDLQGDIKAQQQ